MKEKLKNLIRKYVNKETVSYLIFGVLTTAVNYLALFLFTKAPFIRSLGDAILANPFVTSHWPNLTADGATVLVVNALAWVVAVIFAFVTNKIIVFRSQATAPKDIFRELGSFTLARLLSLGFEELFLFLTVTLAGWNIWIAKIVAAVVVVIMNYFASKFLIFKGKGKKEKEKESEIKEEHTDVRDESADEGL